MFNALYALYRFKNKRSLPSQSGRRRQRNAEEVDLGSVENQEGVESEHYVFTQAERAAKRARRFQDIETEIEAAERYRLEEEDSEFLRISAELIALIMRAETMRLDHPSEIILELDGSYGTKGIDQHVLAKLDAEQLHILQLFSRLDFLNLRARSYSFNIKEDLWGFVLCHQLSTIEMSQQALLRQRQSLGPENLSFTFHQISNHDLVRKVSSIQEFDEFDGEANDLMARIFQNPRVGHNPVAEAIGFFNARPRQGGFMLGGAYWIVVKYKNWLLRGGPKGAIFADKPGTGKTGTLLLGIKGIVDVLVQIWDSLTLEQQGRANRPHFLLCSAQNFGGKRGILADITSICRRDSFNTWIYHGDEPNRYKNHPVGNWMGPDLNKEHDIFTTNLRFTNIVLGSRETIVARHGQPAQVRWLSKRDDINIDAAKTIVESQYGIPHPQFPGNLSGLWSLGVIDECHEFENSGTTAADLLASLGSQYYLFCSGTPLQRSVKSALMYMKYLGNVEDSNFERYPTVNPYTSNREHDAFKRKQCSHSVLLCQIMLALIFIDTSQQIKNVEFGSKLWMAYLSQSV